MRTRNVFTVIFLVAGLALQTLALPVAASCVAGGPTVQEQSCCCPPSACPTSDGGLSNTCCDVRVPSQAEMPATPAPPVHPEAASAPGPSGTEFAGLPPGPAFRSVPADPGNACESPPRYDLFCSYLL